MDTTFWVFSAYIAPGAKTVLQPPHERQWAGGGGGGERAPEFDTLGWGGGISERHYPADFFLYLYNYISFYFPENWLHFYVYVTTASGICVVEYRPFPIISILCLSVINWFIYVLKTF